MKYLAVLLSGIMLVSPVGCTSRQQVTRVISEAPSPVLVLRSLRGQIRQLYFDIEMLHDAGFLKGKKYLKAQKIWRKIAGKFNKLNHTYEKIQKFHENDYREVIESVEVLRRLFESLKEEWCLSYPYCRLLQKSLGLLKPSEKLFMATTRPSMRLEWWILHLKISRSTKIGKKSDACFQLKKTLRFRRKRFKALSCFRRVNPQARVRSGVKSNARGKSSLI